MTTMERKADSIATDDARHEAAVDWLQRLDDPKLSETEIQAWLEWFGTSEQNREAFEEVQLLYRRLRGMPTEYREEIRRRAGPRRPVRDERVPRRRVVWALAAGLAGAAVVLGMWWAVRSAPAEGVYAAPPTQHRDVRLADGSALVLGADSVATVRFNATQRLVNVQHGEAYFEVQHDASRPFVVQIGDVRVTAVGTSFNVLRDSDKVTVTVTEGVVEVMRVPEATAYAATPDTRQGVAEPIRVAMGQRAILPVAQSTQDVAAADEVQAPVWQEGRVEFVNAPLSEVLAVVNVYAPARLFIGDPRVADLTYSGTILRDHLDEWIDSLPRVYPIRTVPLEDGTIALVTRAQTVGAR